MVERKEETLPQTANYASDAQITMEELYLAVRKGKTLQTPGSDALQHDFNFTWGTSNKTY
jgi:hypothetical protein